MPENRWNGGSDNWTLDPSVDWSTGLQPGPTDDVTIDQGDPLVDTDVGTIHSLTNSAQLAIRGGGALKVAADITNSGTLGLDDEYNDSGSRLVVDGALTNTDAGLLEIDSNPYGAEGGTTLTVKGKLTNHGAIHFGTGHLSAPSTVSVGDFDNTGSLSIIGGTTAKATFDAGAGVAPTTLGTSISIAGNAELDYGSGTIAAIGSTGRLTLEGADARINVTGRSGTDSALALTGNAGILSLENGASLTLAGSLTNSGTLGLDDDYNAAGSSLTIDGALTNTGAGTLDVASNPYGAEGGTTLTVKGKLTNQGTVNFGTGHLSAPSAISVGDLDNTGSLSIVGNTSAGTSAKATFDAGAGVAPTTLGTSIRIVGDAELDYGSGTITAIGRTGSLTLDGAKAQINVTGRTGKNSALALTDNAGSFSLDNGATLTLAGPLSNSGTLGIDDTAFADASGSSLTIEGALTNTGAVNIDNPAFATGGGGALTVTGTLTNRGSISVGTVNLSAPTTIGVGRLDNTGSLTIVGNTAAGIAATMSVAGTATDTGTITLYFGATFKAATLTIGPGGTVRLNGGLIDGAVSVKSGGTLEGIGAVGDVTVASGGTLAPGADPGTIGTGSLTLAAGSHFDIQIGGTATGTYDQDVVAGTVSLGGATLDGTLLGVFTPTPGDSFTIIDNDGTDAIGGTFAGLAQGATIDIDGYEFTIDYAGGDGNDVVLTETGPACYGQGTLIRTAEGDLPIEDLAAGTLLVTAAGEHRPVRWTGHRRLDTTRHPNPQSVWPVRVAAHAFGAGRPARDLWVSPGHNIAVGGVLIPAARLVNGATLTQVPVAAVTYWHVELDSHDLILAEGLPAESYLDTGNRTAFANGGAFLELHPDFEPKHWAATCRPLAFHGPAVERARARLLARARARGHAITSAHDLHVVADGRRFEPIDLGDRRYAFALPAGCEDVALVSRIFTPCHVDPRATDRRSLGLCVGRLQIDGTEVDLRADLPPDGWFAWEAGNRLRWTTGQTRLPAGARIVVLDLVGDGRYWVPRTATLAASFTPAVSVQV